MAHRGMKFGIFLAPFHRVGENPTLALDRDMELIEWLDHLGYDEAWIGEHHSAGWELIAVAGDHDRGRRRAHAAHHARLGRDQPAVPPSAAGRQSLRPARSHDARARHARLRARARWCRTPYMMGIEPSTQRRRMDESLDAIMALAPVRRAGHDEDRLVRAARGAAPSGAVHVSALSPSRWRACSRRPASPPRASTASACSRSARACRAARGPRRALEDRRGDGGRRTARRWTAPSGASSSTCTWPRTTSSPCARCTRASGTRP